ncbi:MAG: LytR C-terminal domain-containing protein [Candidatus Nomurabacteria bacterium]|jgi:hypothetical protein|nr:LytR C-terminal domain-containing protein [Candidatus Nomurabacteria bacterium]
MEGKKKTLDGFLPSSKNAGTFFTQSDGPDPNHAKRGIPSRQLLESRKAKDGIEEENPAGREEVDISGIVALPTRNGNGLHIKVPAEESIPDKDLTDIDRHSTREALEFLDEEAAPSDDSEDLKIEDFGFDDEYTNEDDEADPDNDFGVDEEDIENYRSRRQARQRHDKYRGVERNILVRVATIIVILAVIIGASYLLYALFYNAPKPAEVNNTETSSEVTEDSDEAENTALVEEIVTPETPATVMVYNASTTEGAAANLAGQLAEAGMQSEVGGNLSYSGAGYVIFDMTGGQKPTAAVELEKLYGVAPKAATPADLPFDAPQGKDFIVIICP